MKWMYEWRMMMLEGGWTVWAEDKHGRAGGEGLGLDAFHSTYSRGLYIRTTARPHLHVNQARHGQCWHCKCVLWTSSMLTRNRSYSASTTGPLKKTRTRLSMYTYFNLRSTSTMRQQHVDQPRISVFMHVAHHRTKYIPGKRIIQSTHTKTQHIPSAHQHKPASSIPSFPSAQGRIPSSTSSSISARRVLGIPGV